MAGGHGGYREGAGRKPAGYEPTKEKVDYERERAEHERVKREQREFKLAQERGEFIARAAVQQASATALAVLTQSLRSIPDNCERTLALDAAVVEAIQQQIDQALSDVAVAFRSMAGSA